MTNNNLRAFMDMIAVSEGTKGRGDDGYNIIVGGATFSSYADHPRQRVWIPSIGNYSTAAGRYQIIAPTWDGVRRKLSLPDFSPASQDAACAELIRQRGALSDVYAGNIASAISKCAKEWASLPGAGYGQHENAVGNLLAAYQNAGGTIA
ncbi:MAG: glycoside hydrolase family 104 protein [Ralstonia sp.]|nr:lysozyme [Ralstonia pickettii]MBA9881708.1 lysozyme [Ralstonia pickettii]MBA9887075.1 lysozyme [Ralstonia pickettii]MBA9891825.1 lysozyme [Ralstonia pickettii]MBA9923639.1 lysozyme [Ralstonia pickettii]